MESRFHELNVIGREVERLKKNKPSSNNNSSMELQVSLHPLIEELFLLLYKCEKREKQFLCLFLREKLKESKLKRDKPYFVLFEVEQKISSNDFQDRKFQSYLQ